MAHEPSVTPSYHLQKSGLGDWREALLVVLAVRTTCEPTWDLCTPTFWAICPGPSRVHCPEGAHTFCMPGSKGFNFSISPSPWPPTLPPATGQMRHSLTRREWRGGSCSESPKPLGTVGPEVGLRPSILLPTPETLWGDGVHSFEGRHRPEGGWPRRLPAQAGPRAVPAAAAGQSRPGWPALNGSAAFYNIFGLKKSLFLKDKSYLVSIHKVSEVLGELLLLLPAQPLRGSRAGVSSGRGRGAEPGFGRLSSLSGPGVREGPGEPNQPVLGAGDRRSPSRASALFSAVVDQGGSWVLAGPAVSSPWAPGCGAG